MATAQAAGRPVAGLARRPATTPSRASSRSQNLRITCRASGSAPPFPGSSSSGSSTGSTSFGTASPPLDAAALSKRLAELQELLREAAQIALATGPRGLARGVQAASALLSVAREQALRLQAGRTLESPAVVLRKVRQAALLLFRQPLPFVRVLLRGRGHSVLAGLSIVPPN